MQTLQHWPVGLAAGIIIAAGILILHRFIIAYKPGANPLEQPLLPNTEGLTAHFQPEQFQAALSARFIAEQNHIALDEKLEDDGPILGAFNSIPEEISPQKTDAPPEGAPDPNPKRMASAIPHRRYPKQMMMRAITRASPPAVLQAVKVHAGRLVENIPRRMKVGCLQHVEVRVGDQLTPPMIFGLKGDGDVHVHDLPVVETMSLELFSLTQAFTIIQCSEPAQLVQKNVLFNTVFDNPAQLFARWQWNVTPLRAGHHALTLRISAQVSNSRGQPATHTLVPDRDITVHVKVNSGRWLRNALLWVLGALLAAFIGAIIQDQVWPIFRRALF